MSGFTGRRASGASEQSGAEEAIFTWGKSNAMLPLVSRIAEDILSQQEKLSALYAEREKLDRTRHQLAWPQRARRYQVSEEITTTENSLREVLTELDVLGLTLLDSIDGLVGFPTRVNDRRAFFSWKPGEEALSHWCYAGDRSRRPIPHEWTLEDAIEEVPEKTRRKSRR
jgi:hypothetical protein